MGGIRLTALIKDDTCLGFVHEKMIGNLNLLEGWTEQDDIDDYKDNYPHVNYFIPSDRGFLCVAELQSFIFIPYAWYDGSFSARREMVKLGKDLYEHYTRNNKLPIYYTGLKNFYPNHSRELKPNLWVFAP